MSGGIRLETTRLVIRDFVEGDWMAVQEYASDAGVVKHLEWGPNTGGQTREFVSMVMRSSAENPRSSFELALELRDSGMVIGASRIGINNAKYCSGDIGYVLNQAFWGQGYATESVQALLKYGFETLKLHRIIATTHPDNRASGRVLEKCGFRYEGRRREDKLVRGEWRDSLVFSILEQDWGSRKGK